MNDDRSSSIQLKIDKANALFAETDVLMEHGFYATAINRLYYACYHATKALLLTKNLVPKTHSGVVSMLHKHFVQIGLFDQDKASFFSRLMQERMDDDYSDFITLKEEDVEEFVVPAKGYIAYIETLVRLSL